MNFQFVAVRKRVAVAALVLLGIGCPCFALVIAPPTLTGSVSLPAPLWAAAWIPAFTACFYLFPSDSNWRHWVPAVVLGLLVALSIFSFVLAPDATVPVAQSAHALRAL